MLSRAKHPRFNPRELYDECAKRRRLIPVMANFGHMPFDVLLYSIGIAMWANPFLLAVAWVRRVRMAQPDQFRFRMGWASLMIASAGFMALVIGIVLSPEPATPMFDRWFWRWFLVCGSISVLAFLMGVAGKGGMQWVVLFSAVVTPLTFILQLVLQ